MNRYSVRLVKKVHEVRIIDEVKEAVVYTDDILNVLVSGNSKKDARRNLRKISEYSNAMDYRIGRVTQVHKWDEQDGFAIPLRTARLKKHWEE
jgi:hypothetical protein